MDRIILHCDLNSFYASVELRSRPDLQNVPVAVCGDPTSRHGIILAKNEAAKLFGVKNRPKPIWQARRKVPGTSSSCLPTTTSTGITPNWPGRSTPATPTWWSPSALMRAGWT